MDNEEETYGIMLEHLIRFHVNALPGISINVKKVPVVDMVLDNYYLDISYPYHYPDPAVVERYYAAISLKELYRRFVAFRESDHFFRKDSSLEEIELQLAIRNLNG